MNLLDVGIVLMVVVREEVMGEQPKKQTAAGSITSTLRHNVIASMRHFFPKLAGRQATEL